MEWDLGWEEVVEDPEVLDLSHPYPIDLNGSVATMSNVDLEKTIRLPLLFSKCGGMEPEILTIIWQKKKRQLNLKR